MKPTPLKIIWLLLFALALAVPSRGQDFDPVYDVADVMSDLLSVAPNRRLYRDFEFRMMFAMDINHAAKKHAVPELLLTVNTYRESSFRKNALSENTEWYGLGQMHGVASATCDIKTRRGQLDCSAKWLRFCFERCLSWRGAITAYKTNGDCTTASALLKRRVGGIIRTWKKYEHQRQSIHNEIISDLELAAELKEGEL